MAERRVERRRPTLAWAAAGTVLALGLLLLDVWASGDGILRPIHPGATGPSAAVVARDFPGEPIPAHVGLDGQQFYAIARDPFHPKAVAQDLSAPRYRYQRILYPLAAWVLHPAGGGRGLVCALVAVGLIGVFVGGVAVGSLSERLHGPPWVAMLYPLLPGAVWSLTTSVADALAVSLSLVTVVALLRGNHRVAWCAAVAAALTKETTVLVPLALVLGRRRKDDLPVLVLPLLAVGAWFLIVRVWVPGGGGVPEHPVVPFTGLVEAFRTRWSQGKELVGMESTLSAFVVGIFVLLRGQGSRELRWVIGVQIAFLTVCSADVLGNDFGSTRSTLVLLAASMVVLVSGTRGRPPAPEADDIPVMAMTRPR